MRHVDDRGRFGSQQVFFRFSLRELRSLLVVVVILGTSSVVLLSPSLALAATQSPWRVEPITAEAPSASAQLNGISCTSSSCVAVGSYRNASGDPVPLAETLSSSGWSAPSQQPPLPSGGSNGYLSGISCTSSSSCVAVGSYENSSNYWVALAETLSSGTWSVDTLAFLPSGASSGSSLNNISCTSSSCVAVGSYRNTSGDPVPLAETLSNGTWSAPSQPPLPSGVEYGFLHGISCTSSSSCVAVGFYVSSSGDPVPLAETLSGMTWTLDTLASLPSGASSGSSLNNISCTSFSCVAVGFYRNASGDPVPLAETLSNGTWSAPSQQPSAPQGASYSSLYGISCTTTNACVAVGFYRNASGDPVPLAETLSSSGWSAPSQQPPLPSGGIQGKLGGISCTSSSSCVAVGSYYDSSGGLVPLAETYVALAAPVVAPPEAPVLSSLSPSSGTSQGGTLVTLTGENLLGTAFVRFGTTQARSFSVVSPTEIEAMSPPGVGSVPVTVITPGGTSNAVSFTYVQPSPSVTDLTPTRICDTRPDNPSGLTGTEFTQCAGKAPAPGQSLVISIPGVSSHPSVMLGITVIDPGLLAI